jgi:Mg-chelatase subunit ChlD
MRFRPTIYFYALALTMSLRSSSSFGDANPEVTAVQIHGFGVEQEDSFDIYLTFTGGNDEAINEIDRRRLTVELSNQKEPAEVKSVSRFIESGRGYATLLAIDTSGSMSGAASETKKELLSWASDARENLDFIGIGTIADDWALTLALTTDKDRIVKALQNIPKKPSATTALFESIHLGIGYLSHKSPKEFPARRSILVISDGLNEKLGRTADECISAAKIAKIEVNSLIYLPKRNPTALRAKGELEKISRDSGGTTYTATNPTDLRKMLNKILQRQQSELVVSARPVEPAFDRTPATLTVKYGSASDSTPIILSAHPKDSTGTDLGKSMQTRGINRAQIAGLCAAVFLLLIGGWLLRLSRRKRDRRNSPATSNTGSLIPNTPELPKIRQDSPIDMENFTDARRRAQRNKTEFRIPLSEQLTVMKLKIISGAQPGRVIEIPTEGCTLGRHDTNAIVIPDDCVSGEHCKFFWLEPGSPAVLDLTSTNGTYVDGVKVTNKPTKISKGSLIRLGEVVLLAE